MHFEARSSNGDKAGNFIMVTWLIREKEKFKMSMGLRKGL